MSILSTILGVETSGGHNITQGNIGDVNNRTGDLAQGYFQITGATWAQFGGLATGYSSAINAPYATQLTIAQNIPIGRWGPNTLAALRANGYTFSNNQTLGQVLANNGEDPNATIPADGASPGISPGISGSSVSVADPTAELEFDTPSQIGDTFNDTPTLTNSDFSGLTDEDVVGANYSPPLPNDPGSVYSGGTSDLAGDLGGAGSSLPSDPASLFSGSTSNLAGQLGQSGTPLPGQQNTGEASVAGQDVQKGLGTAGTDVENASSGITGTLASAVNALQTYTSNTFVVIALVVLGLIFVAYGLGLFGKRELVAGHV